jgi:hypothetical protein
MGRDVESSVVQRGNLENNTGYKSKFYHNCHHLHTYVMITCKWLKWTTG